MPRGKNATSEPESVQHTGLVEGILRPYISTHALILSHFSSPLMIIFATVLSGNFRCVGSLCSVGLRGSGALPGGGTRPRYGSSSRPPQEQWGGSGLHWCPPVPTQPGVGCMRAGGVFWLMKNQLKNCGLCCLIDNLWLLLSTAEMHNLTSDPFSQNITMPRNEPFLGESVEFLNKLHVSWLPRVISWSIHTESQERKWGRLCPVHSRHMSSPDPEHSAQR